MKFEIFDDEFQEQKVNYFKEIYDLSDQLISKPQRGNWNLFISNTLINTRSYYILLTSLKVMQNLNDGKNYDSSVFEALSFMPDQAFVETVVSIVGVYHKQGKDLASHFHIDLTQYLQNQPKEESAIKQQPKQKKDNKTTNQPSKLKYGTKSHLNPENDDEN